EGTQCTHAPRSLSFLLFSCPQVYEGSDLVFNLPKSKKNLLEQLKSLPHFSKNTVYQLGKQLGLKDSTVETYISRFLKYKEIYRLKNGLYVSADFFDKNKNDISYPFYLANIIRTPSYISSWAALQYYNLTTEAIRSITGADGDEFWIPACAGMTANITP
ncbi:MAG: hypothetical protein UW70_C0066G0001, partial [Candidatus Peregrinibacteria bacterium GW2011_GWA2_44_7]